MINNCDQNQTNGTSHPDTSPANDAAPSSSVDRTDNFMDNVIDLGPLKYNKPPALDFIWGAFLAGTVGALIAPGSTGKSMFALQAVMAVASGRQEADLLRLEPNRKGLVIYLAGEDPRPVLENRLHDLAQHLDPDVWDDIKENVRLISIFGEQIDLMSDEDMQKVIAQSGGARVIVLDTLSRMHTLDENSNSDMARIIGRFEYLSMNTGSSVLFLHHTSKGAAKNNQGDVQQAARGASALIDNSRWCGYLTSMTETQSNSLIDPNCGYKPITEDRRHKYVLYGTSKTNYGRTEPGRWLVRTEDGVLLTADLQSGSADKARSGSTNKSWSSRDKM